MSLSGLRTLLLSFSLIVPVAALADESSGTPPEQLGTVSFANSCSEAVQPELQRAVKLLHSFWWEQGERAFRDVLAKDPSCAIATWGIASILLGNTFSPGPTPAQAQAAAEALAQGRAIDAKTERERGYIEAIGAYYDRFSERPQRARMKSLSDAFQALAQRFPDDDETQIFSALYLTATQDPADKTFAATLKAASILQTQFAKHPDHPGVAHYLIHSYDYPPIADKGLEAALCYADIAPSAPHALHMPSHIFTRVGAWKESVATNTRSAAAAKASGEGISTLHATDYMVYADLQMAHDADAKRLVDEVRQANMAASPANAGPYATAAVPARYAVERGAWAEAKALQPSESRFPYTTAMTLFARAIGAARSGDPAGAEPDVAALGKIVADLKAKDGYWATEVEVQHLAAQGWVAFAKGQREEGLKLMRASADMEDASEKSAVTPGRLLPARELLGDMLMEAGRPAEALAEYEASQTHDPKRFRNVYGAGRAAAAAGNRDKARYHYERLVEMTAGADPRPELIAAREYLAKN
jgi:hypothetical protein